MVSTLRGGPGNGLMAQFVLLAGLAATVGLGTTGWLAGIGYGFLMCLVLAWALRRPYPHVLGPADQVTLSRAVLVGGVTALTVDSITGSAAVEAMVLLAVAALALDGVDGWLARRTGTASAFGARFDTEVDALLLLVLSTYVAAAVHWWVLAIGIMRYAFLAAGRLLPWLRRPLPGRPWRKIVAVTQGVVLLVAAADLLPRPLIVYALGVCLVLLSESFGHDLVWLARQRLVRLSVDAAVATGQRSEVG